MPSIGPEVGFEETKEYDLLQARFWAAETKPKGLPVLFRIADNAGAISFCLNQEFHAKIAE